MGAVRRTHQGVRGGGGPRERGNGKEVHLRAVRMRPGASGDSARARRARRRRRRGFDDPRDHRSGHHARSGGGRLLRAAHHLPPRVFGRHAGRREQAARRRVLARGVTGRLAQAGGSRRDDFPILRRAVWVFAGGVQEPAARRGARDGRVPADFPEPRGRDDPRARRGDERGVRRGPDAAHRGEPDGPLARPRRKRQALHEDRGARRPVGAQGTGRVGACRRNAFRGASSTSTTKGATARKTFCVSRS
mmetsp:Transcript_9989/g.42467  ORF Transcript_9989/g.42467 Transcript_9989/m.42467 type:complete len:248 (-) Transcript_9989:21-764(-)